MQLNLIYICNMQEKEQIRIGDSLVPWLGKTMKLIDNKIEDILAENDIDLSRIQFIVLKNIEKNEGISQNELAFFSKRNKSSLARMIATLERKQYITKHYCTKDKRKCKIHISDLGKQILLESAPYFSDFVTKMETDISDENRAALINVLTKIQNNIIGEGPSPFFKDKK
jgi:DNA-binding MarR family transcriptional regulator